MLPSQHFQRLTTLPSSPKMTIAVAIALRSFPRPVCRPSVSPAASSRSAGRRVLVDAGTEKSPLDDFSCS